MSTPPTIAPPEVPADAKALLSVAEQARLVELETTIEKGLDTYIEVGLALIEIRETKLYRKYGTFEEYVKARFFMTDRRARQLMDAAEVIENLKSETTVHYNMEKTEGGPTEPFSYNMDTGTTVPPLPSSESVARPLTELEPEEQKEVWKEAVKTAPNGKPTADHVKEIAQKRKPKKAQLTKAQAKNKPDEPIVLPNLVESVRQNILRKWDSFVDAFDAADKAHVRRIIFERLATEEQEEFTRTGHHWGETGSSCPKGSENLYH